MPSHLPIATRRPLALSTHHQKISNILKHETSLIYSVLFDSVVPQYVLFITILPQCQKAVLLSCYTCDSLGLQTDGKESRMRCLHAGRKEAKI